MVTSLERIREKIVELEQNIARLRIAERELLALDEKPAPKIRIASAPDAETKAAEPVASQSIEGHQTIGAAITEVLTQRGALSVKEIAEQITSAGRDINNRAISFSLQAMKKRGLVRSADGIWKLTAKGSRQA